MILIIIITITRTITNMVTITITVTIIVIAEMTIADHRITIETDTMTTINRNLNLITESTNRITNNLMIAKIDPRVIAGRSMVIIIKIIQQQQDISHKDKEIIGTVDTMKISISQGKASCLLLRSIIMMERVEEDIIIIRDTITITMIIELERVIQRIGIGRGIDQVMMIDNRIEQVVGAIIIGIHNKASTGIIRREKNRERLEVVR